MRYRGAGIFFYDGWKSLKFLFDFAQLYQLVDDGIDGEAGGRVNLQLAGDVAAVGNDGVDA